MVRKNFIIKNGVLEQYVRTGGKVVIPEDATSIADSIFCYDYDIKSILIIRFQTVCNVDGDIVIGIVLYDYFNSVLFLYGLISHI